MSEYILLTHSGGFIESAPQVFKVLFKAHVNLLLKGLPYIDGSESILLSKKILTDFSKKNSIDLFPTR
jgi:hypothetical protein